GWRVVSSDKMQNHTLEDTVAGSSIETKRAEQNIERRRQIVAAPPRIHTVAAAILRIEMRVSLRMSSDHVEVFPRRPKRERHRRQRPHPRVAFLQNLYVLTRYRDYSVNPFHRPRLHQGVNSSRGRVFRGRSAVGMGLVVVAQPRILKVQD